MTHTHYPHIVIGAGISGLGAAHCAIRAGTPTLVLERADTIGGCMKTLHFPQFNDFWLEAGSHSCFNSYGTLIQLLTDLRQLGQVTAKIKAKYYLWAGGKRRSVLSALHPLELLRSLPQLMRVDKTQCSVKAYYERGLGTRNYRDLFGPAFRSVICQPADEYPAAALFRKKPRRKDVLRSFTFPHGLGDIPAVIAAQPGLTVRTAQHITAVTRHANGWHIMLADGDQLTTAKLTVAVPPDAAATLLAAAAPNIAALVGQIGVAEIDTLLLVLARDQLQLPPLAGLISVDGAFFSAVSRDFHRDDHYRGFAFHFPAGQHDHAAQLAAACAALGTTPAQVAASAHVHNRLPKLRQAQHAPLLAALDQALAGESLAVTGNWFAGVSIEDCLTRSASEMRRLFPT